MVAAVVKKTGSATPRAFDLVQTIIDLENRTHEFTSMRLRVESKGRKAHVATPERRQIRAGRIGTRGLATPDRLSPGDARRG